MSGLDRKESVEVMDSSRALEETVLFEEVDQGVFIEQTGNGDGREGQRNYSEESFSRESVGETSRKDKGKIEFTTNELPMCAPAGEVPIVLAPIVQVQYLQSQSQPQQVHHQSEPSPSPSSSTESNYTPSDDQLESNSEGRRFNLPVEFSDCVDATVAGFMFVFAVVIGIFSCCDDDLIAIDDDD